MGRKRGIVLKEMKGRNLLGLIRGRRRWWQGAGGRRLRIFMCYREMKVIIIGNSIGLLKRGRKLRGLKKAGRGRRGAI